MNWDLFVVWKVYVPRFRVRMTTRVSPERLARASYGDLSIVRCILVDCIYRASVHKWGVFCSVEREHCQIPSQNDHQSIARIASTGELG